MKLNVSIFLVFLLFSSFNLFSQKISINTAKEVAKNQLLLLEKGNLKSATLKQIHYKFTSSSVALENSDTVYFVLNDSINNSFVIVSADRRVWPILGYSLNGILNENNQPPAFVEWMENRKKEIAYIKKYNLLPDSKTMVEWDNLSSSNFNSFTVTTSVDPLLKTTWNQGSYYNFLCPSDVNGPGGHALTGCVATSMAQLMKYWNYPTTGTGSNSYTPYTHPEYGIQSADFGSTTYQWDQMPNSVTSQNNAVATLMFHCGVAVNMDYDSYASSAGMSPTPLENYFNYSTDAEYVVKMVYSDDNWINMLKFELNSHRPVWYRGDGPVGGHAFVCDGYNDAGDFHINWGWGGSADGYYLIGSLSPYPSDGYTFNNNQGAIIKIFPKKVPDAIGSISGNTSVCKGQISVNYFVPSIPNAASYIWTLPSGATGTSTTNSIDVSFGLNAQSGAIKVKAQNSLGVSNESSLNILVNPIPDAAGSITGNNMVCSGTSEIYSIASVSGATNYLWQLPSGWTGNSTTTSITVTTGTSGGIISVAPNNSNCTGASSNLTVTMGAPVSPVSVTATKTAIIAGQSTTLGINGGELNSAPYWVWYTGNCGGTQVGTGNTLLVSPTITTTYCVQATGCGLSTTCKSITINVCPSDLSAGAISGNTMVCPNVSENYSVAAVTGAVSYTWELPAGWSGNSNTNTITVTPGSGGGIIRVSANSADCIGNKSSLSVTTGVPVSPTSATASQTSILEGETTTLSVIGGSLNSAPNWVWYTGSCGGTQIGTGTTLVVSPTATTTYYVQATGCGTTTTCRSVTIDVCGAPDAPKSSSATIGDPANGSNHTINFTLEGVAGADGYSWEYSTNGVNWSQDWYDTTCAEGCYSWVKFGDIPNQSIYFRVRAYKCTPKQYSDYTYSSPQPIYTACDEPASPTVNGATANSLKITLNAETPVANPAITTYSIFCTSSSQYVQSDGTLGNTEVFQTRSAWGTKTISGLAGNTQYCFYAKARNNTGDVRFNASNTACGTTTGALCTTPGTPASAAGTATGQTTASLSWSAGSPAGSSTVNYYWVVGASSSVTYGNGIAQGNTAETSTSVTGLSAGTTYYLRVYAKTSCDGSASGYKTSASFTTTASCITPGTPASATGTATGQTTASLSWSAGSPAGSATVNYFWVVGASSSVTYGNGIAQGNTAETSTSVTGLSAGTTYFLRVYAKTSCDGSASGYKTSTAFTTLVSCTAPSAPVTCSASIGDPANGLEHRTTITCDSVPNAEGYSYEYSWDGIDWEIDWFQNESRTLLVNNGDTPNRAIYYRIRAYNCTPLQYSAYTYVSPQPIYTACDNPSSPTVNGATSNSIKVSLNTEIPTENPLYTTYSIYCTTTGQYVQLNGTLGNTEVFQTRSDWGIKTISGLSPNKEYCFYAKARNVDGDVRFDPTNVACGTTTGSSLTASFTASPINSCSPMIVSFTDQSSGNPTSWLWDVDNNGTVDYTSQNPTHTYNTAGTYSVKLTVTKDSESNSFTRTSYITVNPTVSPEVSISVSPSSIINTGQIAIFTASPTNGGTNPEYQWKVDGVNAGNNSPTYSTNSLTNGQVVTCLMTSNYPCINTSYATSNSITITVLKVCTGPEITQQPANQNKKAPASVSFSVTASGSDNLYKWQYNTGSGWNNVPATSPYSGGTSTQLNISSTTVEMNGYQYRCYISSSCSGETAISEVATLSVGTDCLPVSIIVQPSNQPASEGSSVSFSITVDGTAPFYYFWYKNGVQVNSAYSQSNTNTYATPVLKASDKDNIYYCLITNCSQTYQVKSNNASLQFSEPVKLSVEISAPAPPIPTIFNVGLKFNLPVTNVQNGITVVDGKLEALTGSGDTYNLTVSAKEQTTVTIILSDLIHDLSISANKFEGQTLTYTTGDFTCPQLMSWTPNNETIGNNHPQFRMSFDENLKIGFGGALKVYKVGTNFSVLNIPVNSEMIDGKNITISYPTTQSGLDKNTSYFVLVDGLALADNAGNATEGVNDVTKWFFKTGASFVTNIDPDTEGSDIKIYPNPTTGIITIDGLPENRKSKIEVYAANGKLVLSKISYTSENKIDISKQVPGTYMLLINQQSIKIIKK